MLDNLRLDLSDSTVLENTTDSNTNASAEALNYLKNGGGDSMSKWSSGKVIAYQNGETQSYHYSVPRVASSGSCYNTSNCANNPSSGSWNKDAVVTSYGVGSGKIGVYYNFCAASAGTYCYDTYSGSSSNNPSSDPKSDSLYDLDGDICPAGWRIPTGSTLGELQSLSDIYNGGSPQSMNATDPSSLQYNLSIALSGNFTDYSGRSQGSNGTLWTSTYAGPSYAYTFYVTSSQISIQSFAYRYGAYSVRCILQQ